MTHHMGNDRGARGQTKAGSSPARRAVGHASADAQATDDRAYRRWKRRRSALHESFHGLARHLLLNEPPELLSIRPGQAYRAIALGPPGGGWTGEMDLGRPAIVQDESLRRWMEAQIAVDLAGDLGAELAGYWGDSGYTADEPSDDAIAAAAKADALERLSPRRREMLASAEAGSSFFSDAESAWGFSDALNGHPAVVAAHLSWVCAFTTQLRDDHLRILAALADVLVIDEVLDTEHYLEIAGTARCYCHTWPTPRKESTMPSLPKTKQGQPAATMFIANQSAVAELGDLDVVIDEGRTRLPAGHPLLAFAGRLFNPDGTGGPVREPRPWRRIVQQVDPTTLPAPIPPQRRLVATRYLAVNGVQMTSAGQVFDSASPFAQAIQREQPDVLVPAPDEESQP